MVVFGAILMMGGVLFTAFILTEKEWKLVCPGIIFCLAGILICLGAGTGGKTWMVILGWVIFGLNVGLVVFLIYRLINYAPPEPGINTSEGLIKKAKHLCDVREQMLRKYAQDIDYLILESTYEELPYAYNKLLLDIISTPALGKKPIDPYVAAGIGSGIAGMAGGIMMGTEAQKQLDDYETRLKSFQKNMAKIDNSKEKLYSLVVAIDKITSRSVIPKSADR